MEYDAVIYSLAAVALILAFVVVVLCRIDP